MWKNKYGFQKTTYYSVKTLIVKADWIHQLLLDCLPVQQMRFNCATELHLEKALNHVSSLRSESLIGDSLCGPTTNELS